MTIFSHFLQGMFIAKFIILLLMTVTLTEGAPIYGHYFEETSGEDRSYHIHNFVKRMHKLFSLIQFTIRNNLGIF